MTKLGSVANDTASSGLISPRFAASRRNAARERALGAIRKKLKARKIRKHENVTPTRLESIGMLRGIVGWLQTAKD